MGIFSKIFKKVTTLSGDYNCPTCNKNYKYRYILDDLPGWVDGDNKQRIKIVNKECDFCMTELEVVYFKEYKAEPEILVFKVNIFDGVSYDKSVFINLKTGKFQFPKYKHNKDCFIKIKGCYDEYKDFWSTLEADEKKGFDISALEEHFDGIDVGFEIDSFWELFNKFPVQQLEPFSFLKGKGDELEALVACDLEEIVEGTEKFVLSSELTLSLYECGCFEKFKFQDNNEVLNFKKYALALMLVKDLRSLCITQSLKPKTKKQELIDQLIESNISEDKLPIPLIANINFQNLIEKFGMIYLEDIKKNIEQWHPLYQALVWEEVSGQAENEFVEKMACKRF